jgi:hypothetical protein
LSVDFGASSRRTRATASGRMRVFDHCYWATASLYRADVQLERPWVPQQLKSAPALSWPALWRTSAGICGGIESEMRAGLHRIRCCLWSGIRTANASWRGRRSKLCLDAEFDKLRGYAGVPDNLHSYRSKTGRARHDAFEHCSPPVDTVIRERVNGYEGGSPFGQVTLDRMVNMDC